MFWDGFFKQAMIATKGIKSGLNIAANKSLSVGAKPRTQVAVAGAFKPNKVPTPSVHGSAKQNLAPSLVRDLKQTTPTLPSATGRGVGKVVI